MIEGQTEKKQYHHDVFISYAQQDKPVADAVCAKLEARNIRCWIAPRDVPPGKDFPEAIIDGIEGGRIVVVIFSAHANSSPHVLRELTNAVNKARIIIPFRIEDVLPSKSMEYLISVPHWLDAVTPPLERHIDLLAKTIDCVTGTDKSPTACLAHAMAEERTGTEGKIAGTGDPPDCCTVCHTALSPNVKFCESCGTSVAVRPAPQEYIPPVQEDLPAKSGIKTPELGVVPPPSSHIPEEGDTAAAESASPATSPVVADTVWRPSLMHIGIGIIVALLILAVVLSLAGIFPPLSAQPANTTIQDTPKPDFAGMSEADYYQSLGARIGTVTLTAAPTQTLAKDTELYFNVNKDSTNAIVTVQFNGGPGMGLVRGNRIILTRSDGTVTEKKLNFNERLSSVQLQGSRGTDRLQVIITLHSGEERSIVDTLLPYRQYR